MASSGILAREQLGRPHRRYDGAASAGPIFRPSLNIHTLYAPTQAPTPRELRAPSKEFLIEFDNPNTEAVLKHIARFTDGDAEFCIFGVATAYCVRLAAKGLLERGRRVALVRDAIETLKPEDGQKTIEELTSLGARLISTDQALAALERPKTHTA